MGRITKYVIALDNSFSMDDAIKERNAAARALLYILPQEENVQATLFFFTNETRAPVDLLPMDQEEELATGSAPTLRCSSSGAWANKSRPKNSSAVYQLI